MVAWLVAAALGVGVAVIQYGAGGTRRELPAAALRAAGVALLTALLLDAPAGCSSAVKPFAALDVSASWQRGARAGDTYANALTRFRALAKGADSTFLFGDSMRSGTPPAAPTDTRTASRAIVDRALAAGRPITIVTDGELDDPDALASLPVGSRIEVITRAAGTDAAVASVDAPRAVVGGDTVPVQVTLAAGAGGAPASTLTLSLDGRTLSTTAVAPMEPGAERSVDVRIVAPSHEGVGILHTVIVAPGDVEPRNDTLDRPLEVSPAAGAVFVSTSPDYDARFALAVLRGAVALPTRGFYRVAPGTWRTDGTLAPVAEAEVRRAVEVAPLVVLHGDTALFGAPRAATHGSLALFPGPSGDEAGEWYATGAPASPIAAALSGVLWDSLPPIESPPIGRAGPAQPDLQIERSPSSSVRNYWDGLETKRARRFDPRVAVIGTASGRRVVIIAATGLWRWQFRGGVAADAFAALWGGIFDWLSAERPDVRAALPVDGAVRSGEPIRWRRGTGTDSVVRVVISPRGATGADTVALRFGAASTVESAPMARGVYDVRTAGGTSVLVVNDSREWIPNRARVRSGAVGGGAVAGMAIRLRTVWWIYALVVGVLCWEWVVRRSLGLR